MSKTEKPTGWHVSDYGYDRFYGRYGQDGTMYCLEHSDGRFTDLALFEELSSGDYTLVSRGQTWSELDYDGCWDGCGDEAYEEWFERANGLALAMNVQEALVAEIGGTVCPPTGITVFQPCWDRLTTMHSDHSDTKEGDEVVVEWDVSLSSPTGDFERFRSGEEYYTKGYNNSRDIACIDDIIKAAEAEAEQEIGRRNSSLEKES